jgi:hypothetical protein
MKAKLLLTYNENEIREAILQHSKREVENSEQLAFQITELTTNPLEVVVEICGEDIKRKFQGPL